jgi:nucleoside-diphosphate-sugar epimerase
MRVFVTGGTGLVGRHVVAALAARGDTVTALARSDAAAATLKAAGAEPLRGDVTDQGAIERGAAAADAVVHAAAVVLSRRGWDHYHRTNVTGTELVARAAARHGSRLVHISSVAVYGRRTTYDGGASSVDESFGVNRPIFPGDHYARSKREAEAVVWRVAHEEEPRLSAVALRPCVIYGEGDRQFSIRVARSLRRGIAPMIGNGANPLAVVYAGNVAAAVLAALDRPGTEGSFNVANDGTLTQREFLERFAVGLGTRLRIVRIPRALAWTAAGIVDAATRLARPSAPMALLKTAVQFLGHPNPFVSARAEHELGWRPAVPPDEAAQRTGRWFRDSPPS